MSASVQRFGARCLMLVGAVSLAGLLLGSAGLAVHVRRGFSSHDPPSRAEAFAARTLRRWSVPSAVRRLTNPVKTTSTAIDRAKEHWADHCAICHANDGSGKTNLGEKMYPRAPDMRERATRDLTDGELYAIIRDGIRLTGMPGWGQPNVVDDEETWSLVVFIRYLPRLTSEEIQEMKKLNPQSAHDREEEEFLKGEDE